MHLEIHTLPVLRNEIHMYKKMLREREVLIKEYSEPLQELKDKLLEVEENLKGIKSPVGDGSNSSAQDKTDKYNYLIRKKDELKSTINEYIKLNEDIYHDDLEHWNVRIESAEYYLNKMDVLDRKFIEDFYYNLTKKECMKRYNISNNTSLYRKADNILKKILKN